MHEYANVWNVSSKIIWTVADGVTLVVLYSALTHVPKTNEGRLTFQ